MNGSVSPTGEQHPGRIAYEDRTENELEPRTWYRRADEVSQTMAWVADQHGHWRPVTKIVMKGNIERLEIVRYGISGEMLDSAIDSPSSP